MIKEYPEIFSDIRPYTDSEIPSALQRIAYSSNFPDISRYVYPKMPVNEVQHMLTSISNVKDFQYTVMKDAICVILEKTISNFTVSGCENLKPETSYLFVSNHRDIVVDALLLQYILFKMGRETCQITFGENLMRFPLISDIGRSNKMFKTPRGGSKMSFYRNLSLMSSYIRYMISQGESVWIAQRNGRTKNGLDKTDPALIKMLSLSGSSDPISNICSLNIVPVSVSYQWEPCDSLKAIELTKTIQGNYKKTPTEDVNSIITGITQPKGHTHISIGQPITISDYEHFSHINVRDVFNWTADLIDHRIYSGYHLWANNYIAYDISHHTSVFQEYYNKNELENMNLYIDKIKTLPNFTDDSLEILLNIYANPIINCL
ncbi:MAG: 1-acyl-sn-glycerol-3-phosphate acyltransferase [Bacteroidales bacterium]|nr:1-acyl-sn-glycerol-3-phosphate acyltransferase [Candidatus Colimorpha onthohippi]